MAEPQISVNHQKEEEKNPYLGFFTSLFSAIKEEEKNPYLGFFTSLFSAIKLPFPQQNKKNNGVKINPAAVEPFRTEPDEVKDDYNDVGYVKFPSYRFASLKLVPEAEGAELTTNTVNLWQVYAIAGYYIWRWARMKWNERRGQNDEPPPALE